MAKAVKKVVKRRRERKTIEKGAVHIRSSFNNTMVTVTDANGKEYTACSEALQNARRFSCSHGLLQAVQPQSRRQKKNQEV